MLKEAPPTTNASPSLLIVVSCYQRPTVTIPLWSELATRIRGICPAPPPVWHPDRRLEVTARHLKKVHPSYMMLFLHGLRCVYDLVPPCSTLFHRSWDRLLSGVRPRQIRTLQGQSVTSLDLKSPQFLRCNSQETWISCCKSWPLATQVIHDDICGVMTWLQMNSMSSMMNLLLTWLFLHLVSPELLAQAPRPRCPPASRRKVLRWAWIEIWESMCFNKIYELQPKLS